MNNKKEETLAETNSVLATYSLLSNIDWYDSHRSIKPIYLYNWCSSNKNICFIDQPHLYSSAVVLNKCGYNYPGNWSHVLGQKYFMEHF